MAVKLLEKLYTVDDLVALPDDGKRYELHNGEIVALRTSSRKHTKLGAWMIRVLYDYVEAHGLGERFEVSRSGELDGEPVLDGLKIRLAEMFKVIEGN